MIERALKAAFLDTDLYEEVEKGDRYTLEAGAIVAITSILTGIGSALSGSGFDGFISVTLVGLAGWFVWAGVTLGVGRQLDGDADYGQMLRVIGYAHTPLALGIVPFVGLFIGSAWAFVATVVAVRHGMDFNYLKAFLTTVIGWLAVTVARAVLQFVL